MSNFSSGSGGPQGGKVWLITGCSSGFGRKLVSAVLARGDKVIATARCPLAIQDLPESSSLERLELDVTASESVLSEKIQAAVELFGAIDVLVNNAGFVVSGVVEELRANDYQAQFETNVFGALKMTRVVLPHMRTRRSGTILFMGSIAGWHGVGAGSAYSASKFALEGTAECLSKEVQAFGVRVHVFVLGQFRTGILDQSRKHDALNTEQGISEYAAIKTEMADRHATTHGMQPGDPDVAVERMVDIVRTQSLGVKAVETPPLRIPLGSDAVQVMRAKCQDTLDLLDAWEYFACSTDFPDKMEIPSYSR